MEHDVIILYLIAGVSFTFALFNCILFALKHGKTMKTDGMIVSIKSTNPTNEKWRNAKLAEVYSYSVKRIIIGFLIGVGSILIAVFMQIH